MLSVENVATPAAAAIVAVPARIPLPGFVPMATVTLAVNPVATLPSASRAVTWTAGVMTALAISSLGWTVKKRAAAGAAVIAKAPLAELESPTAAAMSVYPAPG